jgi:hypothetical protein
MTMIDRRAARPSPGSSNGFTALTVRIPVHTRLFDRDVLELPVVVHRVDADTTEVLIDGAFVGYIRRDGTHFLALAGHPLANAQPCGRSDLWDHAIARLYESSL